MVKIPHSPPEHTDFQNLFRFIWDRGVGQDVAEGQLAEQWTITSITDALQGCGCDVSDRTIEHWLSGKFTPSPANLRGLARLISDDQAERSVWLEAMLVARAKSKAGAEHVDKLQEPLDNDQGINDFASRHNIVWFALIAACVLALCLVLFLPTKNLLVQRSIKELKVCDEARFDKLDKKCKENVINFPSDTKRIYASFNLEAFDEGAEFERVWFRCGQRIHAKSSRLIEPWNGWTWFETNDFKKQGPFHLNVLVEGHVASTNFSIGAEGDGACQSSEA